MPSTKKEALNHELLLQNPGAGKLAIPSLRVSLFLNPKTQVPPDYLQKIDREIQFLWKYCPFQLENEFSDLILNYLFTESRIPGLKGPPFSKIHVIIGDRIRHIDKFRFQAEVENTRFGYADSLLLTKTFGVYRLRISPGLEIPKHMHKVMEEKEIMLTDGIHLDGKLLPAGHIQVWPHKTPHRYENKTKEEQSILCIDQPPFDASDEILV